MKQKPNRAITQGDIGRTGRDDETTKFMRYDSGTWTMRFGAHKHKSIDQVPDRYLQWAQKNVEMTEEEKAVIKSTLRGRNQNKPD